MSLRAAFTNAGIVQPGSIKRGGVYMVRDELVVFPEDRLPGAKRTRHEHRYVLVLQCQEDCDAPDIPTVLVAPLSTRKRVKSRFDYELSHGTANLREDDYVKLALVQPMLKTELVKRVGIVDLAKMHDVVTVLLANIGGIRRPIDRPPSSH